MEREVQRKFQKNYMVVFANSLLLVPELLLSDPSQFNMPIEMWGLTLSDAFPTTIYNVLIVPEMTLARTPCSIFLQ